VLRDGGIAPTPFGDMLELIRADAGVARAAEAARGAQLVTDARVSALAARAQALFICPPQDGPIFDSYVSAISLINYLATAALAQAPKKARARMAAIEQVHAQLADLESPL